MTNLPTSVLHMSGILRLPETSLPIQNWTLYTSQRRAILGRSGAGKSTILRLMAGLDDDYSSFEGHLENNAERTALLSQEPALIEAYDLLGNLCLGARLRHEKPDMDFAAHCLDRLGLQGLERRRPSHLSGGQRQRVALARLLFEGADLWLLDEPFSGLDMVTKQEVINYVHELGAHVSMVMVTHDPREAKALSMSCSILSKAEFVEAQEHGDEDDMIRLMQ
jgi:putative hydroxymethylpyrimidine transport system ATP-binding protein